MKKISIILCIFTALLSITHSADAQSGSTIFPVNLLNSQDITRSGNSNTPTFNVNISEALNYTSSYVTHYGMILNALETTGGTGDRIGIGSYQTCNATLAGKSCVGGSLTSIAGGSGVGSYTGSNPRVLLPSGLTGPASAAVGMEIDTDTHSPVLIKNGLRIQDESLIAATITHGSVEDNAINISAAGTTYGGGFTVGIQFGENPQGYPQNWPILASGTLIQASNPNVILSYGFDLSGSTAGFYKQAIALPQNSGGNGIAWGVNNTAGTINSSASTLGNNVVFTQSGITIAPQGGGVQLTLNPVGNVALRISPITIAGLPTCTGAIQGSISYINDSVGSAAPTYHGTVTGGGATNVAGIVSCNGAVWQWD